MERPFHVTHTPPITMEIKYGVNKLSKNGKRMPSKLDHFIVVSRERGQMNYLQLEGVMKALGPTPKSIPIQLLSDVQAENFPLFRGLFAERTGQLACGSIYGEETASRRFVIEDNKFSWVRAYEHPCNEKCHEWQQGKCRITGALYFRLGEGLPHNSGLGILRVKAIYSIKQIRASLEILSNQTGGILANLPLQVSIRYEKKKISTGEIHDIPMISIEPSVSNQEFLEAVESELERRRRIHELSPGRMGPELLIRGVLAGVNNREVIEDGGVVTSGEDDDSVEVEDAPPAIGGFLAKKLEALPSKKAEMFVAQATKSDGSIDTIKLKSILKEDEERQSEEFDL